MSAFKYSKTHQWIKKEGDGYYIGITDYAQNELGNIIFVSLPSVGQHFKRQDESAVVESMKVASEVYAPVSGEIVGVNEELASNPSLINTDPEGLGWFYKMKVDKPEELDMLMSLEQYTSMVQK